MAKHIVMTVSGTGVEWRPVVGCEGAYEVSDSGDVWSVRSGRLLKSFSDNTPRGYLQVELRFNGKRRRARINVLVLEAFSGPRPPGLVACHLNDNSSDNRFVNLQWDTQSANISATVQSGTHRNTAKTQCDNGHEYTPENTWHKSNGWRICIACDRAQQARKRARKMVAA